MKTGVVFITVNYAFRYVSKKIEEFFHLALFIRTRRNAKYYMFATVLSCVSSKQEVFLIDPEPETSFF